MLGKKMSFTRLQKLAMKYGFFARFIPDGTEDEENGDGAVDGAIADSEQADLKDNKEFDKVQQQSDQHKANAERAREDATAKGEQLETANSEVASLKEQLEEAKSAASDAGIDPNKLDEKDFTDTDIQLVQSIKAINKKLEVVETKNKALEGTANEFKANEVEKAAKSKRDEAYQELLGELDSEYGPENRNIAVKAFEAKVTAGEVKGGPAKATRILEQCYKDAAATDKKTGKKKPRVGLDPGSGGGAAPSLSGVELTEGSLEEVTAQAGKLLNKPD